MRSVSSKQLQFRSGPPPGTLPAHGKWTAPPHPTPPFDQCMTLSQLNPMFNHDLQPMHPLIKGLISGSVDHCPNHNGKQLFNFISREAETWQSTGWLVARLCRT